MNAPSTQEEFQHLLAAATVAAGHAEELRASAEDHAAVLPEDVMHNLGALVDELCGLRDAIHDAGLDPDDHMVQPRRQRPGDARPPARFVELPIMPKDDQ